jgi:transposase
LLQRIKSGEIDGKSLDQTARRTIAVYLLSEGYSVQETAEILKVSDRTIERDKKAFRQANAIERDPSLVKEMAGRLITEAELCVHRIRKFARDKDAAPGVKIEAEHRCYQIIADEIQRLQGLGYLPTAAQKIEADLTHYAGQVPDLATLRSQVDQLKEIASTTSPESRKQLCALEDEVKRAELASSIDQLKSQLDEETDND